MENYAKFTPEQGFDMDSNRPKKFLCKRTMIVGTPYYYDEYEHQIEWDNRVLVKGVWYDIVYNPNDVWTEKEKTFSIIDNQGSKHLFYIYRPEDKEYWPSLFCKQYGPRDYSKWFYTPEELLIRENREKLK